MVFFFDTTLAHDYSSQVSTMAGVLILMETALCLVEANQPVYPLDLTRLGIVGMDEVGFHK